jgi:hypothetical protein
MAKHIKIVALRAVYSHLRLTGECTLVIPTGDFEGLKDRIIQLKNRTNRKIKEEGGEPEERKLIFYLSPHQSIESASYLNIQLFSN